MSKNWNVHINREGDLLIHARKQNNGIVDLFGSQQVEYGICIYGHYLRSVRQLLSSLFPNAGIRSIEAIESVIQEEFCNVRSISIFRSLMDKAGIPYRSYSNAA